MESDRRSSFLFGRILFDEPASTSSENALAFWFGRIFCDEPASTSSENALAFWFGRIFFDKPVSTSSENAPAPCPVVSLWLIAAGSFLFDTKKKALHLHRVEGQ